MTPRRNRFLKATFTAALSAGLLGSASARAAVPDTLTHQGRLYDAKGAPVSEELVVTFTIYDAATGGGALWTEARSIAFDEGYFSVSLGELVPLDTKVFDGSVRYLGIQVGADPEMTPRAATRSVPYALMAGDVRGDISPQSISIEGVGLVIDANGQWVGDSAGLAGPQGPAGAQGPAGPQGANGAPGATGATGPQGSTGAQGPAGPIGPRDRPVKQGRPGQPGRWGHKVRPVPAVPRDRRDRRDRQGPPSTLDSRGRPLPRTRLSRQRTRNATPSSGALIARPRRST